jgi:serine carboxypeptidase-like clade IV
MANLSFFFFSLLFCSIASSSLILPNLELPSFSHFPYTDAESLIRALNLFPKDATPQSSSNLPQLGENKIIEKKFIFPFLASDGATIEELGHHAGYYSLNNKKDARYSFIVCLI